MQRTFGWFDIVRIGLVQASLGAVVVLATSTLNRVMVIEAGLPAMAPGFLVAMHYAVQVLRPRWGHGSDNGGRRTPWIIGGMAMLASGGVLAACATAWMLTDTTAGMLLAVLAFLLIGIGVGAAGTSVLVLLSEGAPDARRGVSAAVVWMMMIAGFAVTAITAGHMLDPFSATRLVMVSAVVSLAAFLLTVASILGLEGRRRAPSAASLVKRDFRAALREAWSEPEIRRFTIFIFLSMLAYNAQDLLLEPYAGIIFAMTPGETTKLGGLLHGGVLVGMIFVALAGMRGRDSDISLLKRFMVGGCLAAALFMATVAGVGAYGPAWSLKVAVVLLGVANGCFSIAAIGCMMALARTGNPERAGLRMGVWGASQAVAFAVGGFAGTIAVDLARTLTASPLAAYSAVFLGEAAAFLAAAVIASTIAGRDAKRPLNANHILETATR